MKKKMNPVVKISLYAVAAAAVAGGLFWMFGSKKPDANNDDPIVPQPAVASGDDVVTCPSGWLPKKSASGKTVCVRVSANSTPIQSNPSSNSNLDGLHDVSI